jgi:nitrogen fixation NifU-like protein
MNQDQAREILLNHSRSDRNGKFPEYFTHESKLTNPLCGDHVELKIHLHDDKIQDIGFKAVACAICSASSSLLTQVLKGQSLQTALKMQLDFESSVMGAYETPWPLDLESLGCFEHLRVTPSRKVCALLPWVALKAALKPNKLI